MKKLKYILIFIAVLGCGTLMAQKHQISSDQTSIKWTASKVGGTHHGTISLKEGHLNWDNDKIASGKFVIDMTSVTNTDLENEGYNKKLVDHIKSDDFFGAEEFPEAVLEITESTPFENGKAIVKANLTIRGITHPIEFEAVKETERLLAKLTINRSMYEVKFRSKSFFKNLGDKLIHDEFTLEIIVNK